MSTPEPVVIEAIIQDNYFSPTVEPNPIEETTWATWFQSWLQSMQAELPPATAYELTLRFTTDEEIHALNSQYRHKDQPTDVLAFAALETDFPASPDPAEPLYLGDLVISVETAQHQASQQHHDLVTELAWLAAHGFLHLLGWDHPTDEDLRVMLSQQQRLLAEIGIEMVNLYTA
jgi:probable rRNA maturation factor